MKWRRKRESKQAQNSMAQKLLASTVLLTAKSLMAPIPNLQDYRKTEQN